MVAQDLRVVIFSTCVGNQPHLSIAHKMHLLSALHDLILTANLLLEAANKPSLKSTNMTFKVKEGLYDASEPIFYI